MMNRKNSICSVGILTFWNVPNYGTFAQAYALQKVIEKLCEDDKEVNQIAYLNKLHYNYYFSEVPHISKKKLTFYREFISRKFPHSRYNLRKRMFLNSYDTIPHTETMDAEKLRKTKFSTVVLGSDIIWDYSFEIFGKDKFLFGNDFNSSNIISYAASFGTITLLDKLPSYVINGIKKLDSISVRDEKSADIVANITGARPEVVLDPTWLWDFYNDSLIVKSQYSNYMIVYGQDFSNSKILEICDYAKSNGYMLVCLDCNNDNYDWCDVVLKQHQLTPYQWLGLFKYAEAIVTTTFHGLTFSLIFGKQLAFCKTNFIVAKADSFLKRIGLYNLFVENDPTITEMMNYNFDYEKIWGLIEEDRENSLHYLKKALKIGE